MDNKKFEQLIDLIINEDEEKARALFHDIVVEKSREIYESIMDEELEEAKEEDDEDTIEESFDDMDEASLDEVGGLMDEVRADESGLGEDDEEFTDVEVDDETGLGDEGDMDVEVDGDTEIKDELLNIEDKLDELMSEFEELMSKIDGEEAGDEEDFGGEEDFGDEEEDFSDEESLAEAVQLQKVSVTHGDNGQNTKSPVSGGSKVSANGAKAVSLGGGDGGKGGTQGGLLNPTTKDLKGAGQFKNAPGGKKADLEAAPKPKHGDNGQNTKSITSESRKTTKRIVK